MISRWKSGMACLWVLMAVVIIFPPLKSAAQKKQVIPATQTWFGIYEQARFSNRWGAALDIQLRTKDHFLTGLSQGAIRGSAVYYMNEGLRFSAGYAFFNYFPGDNHAHISQPEHRLWQQVQWIDNNRKYRLIHVVRLEERFRRNILNDYTLAHGNMFNYRARYQLAAYVPFGHQHFSPGSLTWFISDEILINFGKEIRTNYFDQNRFSTGLQYHLTSQKSVQFAYLNVYQQTSAKRVFRKTDVIRLSFFHNTDFRKPRN